MEDKESSNIVVELTEEQTNIIKNAKACSLILKPFKPPKPKIQKIDMSVCIESDIDCEFGDKNEPTIGKLEHIKDSDYNNFPFVMKNDKDNEAWKECRVRENHWHPWSGGGPSPLPDGLAVDLLLRNGEISNNHQTPTNNLNHTWYYIMPKDGLDVIAFKVTGVVEGYEY